MKSKLTHYYYMLSYSSFILIILLSSCKTCEQKTEENANPINNDVIATQHELIEKPSNFAKDLSKESTSSKKQNFEDDNFDFSDEDTDVNALLNRLEQKLSDDDFNPTDQFVFQKEYFPQNNISNVEYLSMQEINNLTESKKQEYIKTLSAAIFNNENVELITNIFNYVIETKLFNIADYEEKRIFFGESLRDNETDFTKIGKRVDNSYQDLFQVTEEKGKTTKNFVYTNSFITSEIHFKYNKKGKLIESGSTYSIKGQKIKL